MRIIIFDITEPCLATITDWFDAMCGFRPKRAQIVSFCVKTVLDLNPQEITNLKRKHFAADKNSRIMLDPQTACLINTYYDMYKGYFSNIHEVVNVAIWHRVKNLPKAKEPEPMRIKYAPRKGDYIPRLGAMIREMAS